MVLVRVAWYWPGRQAGLKFLDRIVAVDGQPVCDGRDVFRMAAEKEPSTPVHYLVESGGKLREIYADEMLFNGKAPILTYGRMLLCSFLGAGCPLPIQSRWGLAGRA